MAKPSSSSLPIGKSNAKELREPLEESTSMREPETRHQRLLSVWKTHVTDPALEDYSAECECRIPYRCTCNSHENVENLYSAQGSNNKWKEEDMTTDQIGERRDHGKSNVHSEDDFDENIKNLDPRVQKLLKTYEEVFGALPPPGSCRKLVEMNLMLKPKFEKQRLNGRPYPASADHVEEIERQVQECMHAELVLE